MNKYKLIKEYPGSLQLGTKILSDDSQFVTNFPEFWEKVVEKEYEILSYISTDKHISIKQKNNLFYYNSNGHFVSEEALLRLKSTIHSVKRLSDGEVFTIGDNVRYIHSKESLSLQIVKIAYEKLGKTPEALYIYTENGSQSTINNYLHVIKPSFTTEDGVDMFSGDKYYFIVIDDNPSLNPWIARVDIVNWNNEKTTPLGKIQFSTEKAAENYIKCHKPVLSYNDISKMMIDYNGDFFFRAYIKSDLLKLVKNKL